MKNTALLLTLLFFALTVTAQNKTEAIKGNGHIIKEKREIASFSKINVEGPFEVLLVQGKAGSITIIGDENILKLISTDVKNNTLSITSKGKCFKTGRDNKIVVRVPFDVLTEVAVNSCGTVNTKKTLTSDVKIIFIDKNDNKIANTTKYQFNRIESRSYYLPS